MRNPSDKATPNKEVADIEAGQSSLFDKGV